MKRILLLAVCLVAMATAQAQAQKIPLYSEVFDEHTNKLSSREWRSAEGHLRQETPRNDGTFKVTVYRADSLKFYEIVERTKIVAELPLSKQLTPGQMVEVVKDAGSTRELTGRETIEGYDCAVYRITKHRTLANGQSESSYHTEWYYEPLDLVICYVESLNVMNLITRNIVQGAQPAHLFEIPRDYKWFDTSAAMEQMRDQFDAMKNAAEMLKQGQQEQNRKLDEIKNDPNKTEQQKIIEALKMMGSEKKK
ncbi:MAG: DUF4412 domain-containing protein [Tannerella sp.]|jgi:hypothetical protein|nr:DUF4412 domain-containing protein [Tannerella sp.]